MNLWREMKDLSNCQEFHDENYWGLEAVMQFKRNKGMKMQFTELAHFTHGTSL